MYLMSASLATMSARTPVSSRTSRRAVWSGFSPSSMEPLGRAMSSASVGVRLDFRSLMLRRGRSMCGSITARYQRPRILRRTTPPAENSRTMGIRKERVVSQQVGGKAITDLHGSHGPNGYYEDKFLERQDPYKRLCGYPGRS